MRALPVANQEMLTADCAERCQMIEGSPDALAAVRPTVLRASREIGIRRGMLTILLGWRGGRGGTFPR